MQKKLDGNTGLWALLRKWSIFSLLEQTQRQKQLIGDISPVSPLPAVAFSLFRFDQRVRIGAFCLKIQR